jgi:hypothetical protein
MYTPGCCSGGPVGLSGFGQDETGSEVATEAGATTAALGPMARSNHEFSWMALFGVSVLAGLTINYLVKRRG